MAGPRRGKRGEGARKGARILIVEARYYDDIADALLAGAMQALEEAGAEFERISVPGSLEIPAAIAIALDAAQRRRRPYDGAVALGCVIRGDTIHFEIVSHQSARGLMDLSIDARRADRQRHHHRRQRSAGLGPRARGGAGQGRRRGARGAGAGAAQARLAGSVEMARRRTATKRARPTSAARRGSPPCRRSIRWISPAPA